MTLSSVAEFNLVYNINFALLYLLLSVSWMIFRKRKMLISIRKSEVLTFDGLLWYVIMAVGQSAGIAFVENWLLEKGLSLFNPTTGVVIFLVLG
jgi:hypothetical protein